jgi:hypothetical protein
MKIAIFLQVMQIKQNRIPEDNIFIYYRPSYSVESLFLICLLKRKLISYPCVIIRSYLLSWLNIYEFC